MPDLPLELINNILITRPVHPLAAIVKENVKNWLVNYTQDELCIADTAEAWMVKMHNRWPEKKPMTKSHIFIEALLNSKAIFLYEYYDGLHIVCDVEDSGRFEACLCTSSDTWYRFYKFFRNFHSLEKLSITSRFSGEWGRSYEYYPQEDGFEALLSGVSLKTLRVWWGAQVAPHLLSGLPILEYYDSYESLDSGHMCCVENLVKKNGKNEHCTVGVIKIDVGEDFCFKTQLIKTVREGHGIWNETVDIDQLAHIQGQFPDSKIVLI